MDNHICKICGEEVVENNHFWKIHKIKEMDYYQKYLPRYSKQTGELINFKTREFYLNSDFNDKREMNAWFKENPKESLVYGMQILYNRAIQKKLNYLPSQVELRSLMMPSWIWYKKFHGTYKEIFEFLQLGSEQGMKLRFDREDIIAYGEFSPRDQIIIDSREQNPLKFKDISTEVCKLEYGDYALSPDKYKVHIERKNLSDFVGTLGVGSDRFCREIERAKKDRAYLVVLVESKLGDALAFNYLPQMKYCKVSPDYIFHNVRDIMQKYFNIQFLFVDGRKEAVEYVKKIFNMKKHVKHYDLQYYYETKQL